GHSAGEKNADALFDGDGRVRRAIARADHDVAEVEVIRRHVYGEQRLRPLPAIDSEFLREKSEDESSRGVLDEDDPLEAVLIVGRERDDELLDGRVDAAEERHAQQQGFCLLQQPLADDIGRDRADEEDGNGRGQDAEARQFAAEILDIERPDESVNEAEQPEQRRNGNEQRDGDEETGDETSTEPLHNQSKTTPINDDA